MTTALKGLFAVINSRRTLNSSVASFTDRAFAPLLPMRRHKVAESPEPKVFQTVSMYAIHIFFSILFLLVSLAGLTLTVERYLRVPLVAKAVGVLLFCLLMFFVEHFIGLGSLTWVFPLTTAYGAWMLYNHRERARQREFWLGEAVFAAAFLYGFAWRFMFPSISPSSEQVTDLFFIANYLGGDTLPPLDLWNPPHSFDYYYAFQHYAAALMGRIMGTDPGTTYSFGVALIGALPIALTWWIVSRLTPRWPLQLLLVATFALGGNGLSLLQHIAYKNPANSVSAANGSDKQRASKQEHYARENIIGNVRYIGGSRDEKYTEDATLRKGIGTLLFPETTAVDKKTKKKMVLPAENFGYQYFIGDYHPSFGGFFLLVLALALILMIEQGLHRRLSQGLLTALIPLMMITNTWVFPLLVFLIGAWGLYRLITRQELAWGWLFGGGIASTFLIYPFLIGFTSNSLPTPIKFVEWGAHTPFSRFLVTHWPVFVFSGLSFFLKQYRGLAISLALGWLFMLGLSEVVYIDDPTGDHFRRTNTTMKWWGWIHSGMFVSLGALLIASKQKWLRITSIVIMLCINVVLLDLTRYWWHSGKWYRGHLNGHNWVTRDDTNREMFEYLDEAPFGIVLENVYDNAYVNTSIYSIFNGKPVLLGWRSHLMTWHGRVPRAWILGDEIQSFYKGELADPELWLKAHDVRYIVFNQKDKDQHFDKIDSQINSTFEWFEFNHSRSRHVGIWVRIDD